MIRYQNYRMRVIETRYKKLDYETEKITEIVRYMIQEKFSWLFGWSWITGVDREVAKYAVIGCTVTRILDDRPDYFGFFKQEDAIDYMKKRMKNWKDNLDGEAAYRIEKRLKKKLERKHRKELKPTHKVICEMTMLDIDK